MKTNNSRKLFERDVFIKGSHADIHKRLMSTALFNNNHDVAEFAMMVGLLFNKTDKSNDSGIETFKIGKETMRDSGDLIKKLYRLCMLIHDSYIPQKERLERAFGYDMQGENAVIYEETLESYMRGGYLILDEKIMKAGPHNSKNMTFIDFVRNEYNFLNEIDEIMNKKFSGSYVEKPLTTVDILNKA